MRELSHWDDAPSETSDLDRIGGTETWLSGAVGARRLGASRVEVPAGKASTPQHAEDEELFYVLGGSGWSVQEDGCFAIGAGDVVHYRAWEPAHTVVAGDDGIAYIAFGTVDSTAAGTRFPRIDKVQLSGHLLTGDHTHQWELENALPRVGVKDPPDPRPKTIVNLSEIEPRPFGGATVRRATGVLGSEGIGLGVAEAAAGQEFATLHCHARDEELFVVLDGEGFLLLGDDEHPVRTGSIVSRPPGSRVPHTFRAGGQAMTLLMLSDRHPDDTIWYPRSGKVYFRGLGVSVAAEVA